MNRRLAVLLAALLLIGGALARAQEDELDSPRLRIQWSEFKKLYDAGRVVVIDVRALESYKAGHIPGARSVPLDEVEERADELKKLKKPIVTYCA